ncbi:uncharacterized protein TNCV_763551 [Trichonephila clavipes]|nr:uncharacterized protein TNCV_763551 [Trichonephila clavipes]
MLPWPARSSYLSPIEHVWNIIGQHLHPHPQPALTVPVLTQQAWNSIPQRDLLHLYDTMCARLKRNKTLRWPGAFHLSSPSTNHTRRLAARWLFRVPQATQRHYTFANIHVFSRIRTHSLRHRSQRR